MSRGHGAVERAILRNIERNKFSALPAIAFISQFNWANQSVRQSFSRAARRLAEQGKVDLYYHQLPFALGFDGGPTDYRDTICVAWPDLDVYHDTDALRNFVAGHSLFLGWDWQEDE
jgi:hypothetical protein